MARQFLRTYELTVTPTDGDVRIIKDLRISFEITKSVLSFPNLAKIDIYNVSEDTLAALQNKFTKISLNAGYKDNVRLLFKGEIRNSFQSQAGIDSVVTIYAGDGQRDWENATFNKTFSETVTIKRAVDEILKTFTELTVGILDGVPDVADKTGGQTLSGSSKNLMDQYAREYGFDWSIQDGEIVTNPTESIIEEGDAILVTSETGMIGSPTVTEIGVDVTTLLNPRMLPNRAFVISSTAADVQIGNLLFTKARRTRAEGTYRIDEVLFKGDSRERDWTSRAKGRLVIG